MANTTAADKAENKETKAAEKGKDENTKAADKAQKDELKKDPSEKDGQTNTEPLEDKEKPAAKLKNAGDVYKEEPTKEQKIINYVGASKTDKVDLVPLLKSLYPLVSHSEPAKYRNQGEAKRLRILLEKMVGEGTLVMVDDAYKQLGKNYYAENDPVTKFHTIDSVKVVAVK